MKERFKPLVGKVKLKCFHAYEGLNETSKMKSNSSSRESSPSAMKTPDMKSDSDGDSKDTGENSEDLYKSLLNEEPLTVPSSSQEKGTMTEPLIKKKKKNKCSSNLITGFSNLHSSFDTIPKNKADKAPAVILSKPSTESAKVSVGPALVGLDTSQSKKLNTFKVALSEQDNVPSCGENLIRKDPPSILSSPSKGTPLGRENISLSSLPLLKSQVLPAQFKGFTTIKGKQQKLSISSIRSICLKGKKLKKKMFSSNFGSEAGSKECERQKIEHPHSQGTSDKGRSANISHPVAVEPALTDTDYPHYLSRSVFGSPTSSKSPPDIMLHNDKINILRQMSQVFNDEKCKVSTKPEGIKTSPSPSSSSENCNNSKKLPLDELNHTLKPVEKPTKTASATTTTVTTTSTSTTMAPSSVTTYSAPITPTTITPSVLSISKSQENLCQMSYVECNISKKTDSGLSPKNHVNPVIPRKYSTRTLTKDDEQASVTNPDVKEHEDKLQEPTNTPVHLVSSHSLEKEESIKVKSYVGSKGEDIDVIDGFTFFSFVSESEMISYSPSKSLKNLKQRKKLTKVKTPIKITSPNTSSTSSLADNSPIAPDISMEVSNGIKDEIQTRLNLSESASSQECKGGTPTRVKEITEKTEVNQLDSDKTKFVEHSAFSSNDLEEYLTEHAQLKISFPIPKCKATESITKYDEEGNPILVPNKPAVSISSALTANAPITLHPNKAPILSSNKKPPDSPPVSVHPHSLPCLPVSHVPIEQVPHSARLPPKESAPTSLSKVNGDSIFVKRRGCLLPLSSLTKRTDGSDIEGGCNKAIDMIYLYHAGRLLTLAGSLTKVSPTNCRAIRARVALPRGHGRLLKHSHKVQSRKVKAVEINADLAEFALSALKTPTKEEKPPFLVGSVNPPKRQMDEDTKDGKFLKPSKENILEILTAKFALDKDSKLDNPEKGVIEGCDCRSLSLERSHTAGSFCSPLDGVNNRSSGTTVPSKIMWNQDDILKKKKVPTPLMEPSKALRKNINRFPSLSREMKRLNMNFVNCDKGTESEKSDKSDDELVEPCSNSFCALGCICESLKCRRRSPDHCGRAECMFGCSCTIESWKGSHRKGTPINVLSIFNADLERQENVAVKEKDFRKTIVQSGSDVFLIGGEKRKRDIKIPQRFKDSDFWTGPFAETPDSTSNNKENVPILPSAYKLHIKDFRLNVPWYDIEGASVWCMVHSCYDCYCLSDCDFYDTISEEEGVSASSVPSAPPYLLPSPVLTWNKGAQLESSHFDDTLPHSPTESKIVHFILKLNPLDPSGGTACDRGKVTLKHWIHNGALFCARSCGYIVKNAVTKDMGHAIKKGYSLPLPKYPFVMGITLKKTDGGEHIRKMSSDLESMSSRRKATFYDGLGPGLQLPSATPQTDDLFSRLVERGQYLSSIYLKSFEDTEFRPSLSISTSHSSTPSLKNVHSTTSIDQSSDPNIIPDLAKDAPHLNTPYIESNHKKRQGISPDSLGDFSNGGGEVKVCMNSNQISSEDVMQNGRDKTFSLSDMIREEEKRGELELDLTPKEQGKAILVTESRFRKLINMNIIGITGLNKAGRCTISTVKSSEDLVKMQRIQHLISNDLIDVGPNMRGIFTPSLQSEQRIRYVMIRCDAVGKWEIVGVVQRKQKEGSSPIILKPKRQKPSRVQPQLTKSSIVSGSKFVKSKSVLGSCTGTSGDAGKMEVTTAVPLSLTNDSVNSLRSDLGISSKSTPEGFVLEKADENDHGLPCIASVHSHSDAEIGTLINSTPLITPYLPSPVAVVDSQMQPEPFPKRTTPILTSFVLNQPSGKVFGGYMKNSGSKDDLVPSMNLTQTTLAFVPGDSIFRGAFKFNNTPIQTEATHPHSKIVLYPQPLLSPLVSAQQEPSTSRQQEKVKMLLVPSTTAPGKSLLIPAPSNDLPASYTLVLRKPDSEPTPTIVTPPLSSPSSTSIFFEKKSTAPVSLLPPTLQKTFPIVYSSSSFTTQAAATLALQVSSPIVSTVFSSQHDNAIMASGSPWNVSPTFKMNIPNAAAAFPNLTASFTDSSITDSSITLEKSCGSSKFASITESSLCIGKFSESSSTTAITLSQSLVSNQLNYTCSESSKGSISSPIAIDANDPAKIKEASSGDANSPDVKCISVTNQNNCTAVDLSIKFKSIKLHWLSGTIKKELLLNIFKMSKKINSLISLSAKSESIQSSFLGMYRFCLDDEGNCYPILVLGTKPSCVLSLSRMTLREMFRSNTIKYLIRETTGELSTYTYDVKGVNLIKFGSKRRDMKSKIIGLGQKVPVELMRESSPLDTTIPMEMHMSSHSKQVNEEIVISDDSESEALPAERNKNFNAENEEKPLFDDSPQQPSRLPLVSSLKAITPTMTNNQEETGSHGEMDSLSVTQSPFALCKRKLDHLLERNSAVTSGEQCNDLKKLKTLSSSPSHSRSLKLEMSKMESSSLPFRKKPVLKIPNVNKLSLSTPGATIHDSDQKGKLKSSHLVSPSKSSPSKLHLNPNSVRKNDLSLTSPLSPVSPNSKISSTKSAILKVSPSTTSSLKYFPPMKYPLKPSSLKAVQKPLIKWSVVKDSPLPESIDVQTMKEHPRKLLSEPPKINEASLKGPINNDKRDVPKSSSSSVNLAISSLGETCLEVDDIEMVSLPDKVTHSVGVPPVESSLSPKDKALKRVKTTVDVSSSPGSKYEANISCPPTMLSKMPMSEAGLPNYRKFKGGITSIVEDSSNSNSMSSIQEENIDVEGDPDVNIAELLHSQLRECISASSVKSEKPCPLSKKQPQKQTKYAQNLKSTSSPKTANGLKKLTKTKSSHNTQSLIGQEFQQVFSSAPQFWLMDYTEKHNALERIRRKGLSKMLENLYAKTTETNSPITRLPAKHVVLKVAEKLIMTLRAKDVSLAKMEISLREKKTRLLNQLSDLLKDTNEEVQREFEHWISAHISNPTAKSKFEDSWKPPKVTFEDEHIMTTSCGQLTVRGTDITTYFATHTAGFTHSRGMPKSRGLVSKAQQIARKKYMFPMVSGSKHHLHSQQSHTPKSKLSHLIKSTSFPSLKGSIAQNAVGSTLVASGSNTRDDAALDEGQAEADDMVLHLSSPPNELVDGHKGCSALSRSDGKKRKNPFHNNRSSHPEEGETTLDDSYEALPSMHWFQKQSIQACKEISNDASSSSRLSVTSEDSGDELKLSSTSVSSPSSG